MAIRVVANEDGVWEETFAEDEKEERVLSRALITPSDAFNAGKVDPNKSERGGLEQRTRALARKAKQHASDPIQNPALNQIEFHELLAKLYKLTQGD
jgi:hypothetical protein